MSKKQGGGIARNFVGIAAVVMIMAAIAAILKMQMIGRKTAMLRALEQPCLGC
jgi:hypothetical protein